ncbi:hypothetical protein FQZ97_798610 [compost metagenome]
MYRTSAVLYSITIHISLPSGIVISGPVEAKIVRGTGSQLEAWSPHKFFIGRPSVAQRIGSGIWSGKIGTGNFVGRLPVTILFFPAGRKISSPNSTQGIKVFCPWQNGYRQTRCGKATYRRPATFCTTGT